VRTASFQRSAVLQQPLKAVGSFTPHGFEGQWAGPFETLDDAVIAVPGQPSLAVTADGTAIRARSGDVLAPGQFIAGTLLSDEQRRRQVFYQQLLDPDGYPPIHGPTLLGWTEPLDMGFQFPEAVERVGSALWAIPLELRRPESGTTVVVPSPLVKYRVVKGPHGQGLSPLYDARTGHWVRASAASNVWLRFQVPREILPIDVQQARLTMRVTAPSRDVRIVRLVDGQVQTLAEHRNPIGQVQLAIDSSSVPELDEAGGLALGVIVSRVTDEDMEEKKATWKVDSLQLEITGQVP
jgi:hypothetical protein